eukprot:3083850-Heterocapsa_arctica.AAC.1
MDSLSVSTGYLNFREKLRILFHNLETKQTEEFKCWKACRVNRERTVFPLNESAYAVQPYGVVVLPKCQRSPRRRPDVRIHSRPLERQRDY